LSLEQAVAYTQDVALKAAAAQTARKKLDELTPREREVAALVAQAKSNGEIAQELVVSKRTVETHIANIRSKLRFTNRAQIVRWALETGLTKSTE
jgi:non-specific serine/threonine protein kinase